MNKKLSLSAFNMHSLRSAVRSVLLYQHERISVVIVLLGLVISLVMIGSIFFRNPSAEELSPTASSRILNTDSIDELELWVEDRQTAYEEGLNLSGRNYFVRQIETP